MSGSNQLGAVYSVVRSCHSFEMEKVQRWTEAGIELWLPQAVISGPPNGIRRCAMTSLADSRRTKIISLSTDAGTSGPTQSQKHRIRAAL